MFMNIPPFQPREGVRHPRVQDGHRAAQLLHQQRFLLKGGARPEQPGCEIQDQVRRPGGILQGRGRAGE